jgi:hypothetical protein
MRALIVNCTLKPSPQDSDTEALAAVVADAMREREVEVSTVRAVDFDIKPGVSADMGSGDAWPAIREQVLDSRILVIAGALGDIGFTTPGQAWTYWHLGPGPGPDYLEEKRGHEWAHKTGRAMAANLVGVARALEAMPLGAPPE